jgi:hypothetical protein
VALVVHPSRYIDARGRAIGVRRCPLPHRAQGLQPADVLPRLVVQSFIAASGTLFKAEAYREAGELDERLWYLADWDYWLRLASLGRTIYHPLPLASCRLHADSLSMARAACGTDLRRQHESVLKRHLSNIQRLGIDKPGVSEAALWSTQVNLALLAAAGGQPIPWRHVCRALSLSPAAWFRYWRDARLCERLAARLRAGALSWRGPRERALGDANFQRVSSHERALDEQAIRRSREPERHAPLEAIHHAQRDDYGLVSTARSCSACQATKATVNAAHHRQSRGLRPRVISQAPQVAAGRAQRDDRGLRAVGPARRHARLGRGAA